MSPAAVFECWSPSCPALCHLVLGVVARAVHLAWGKKIKAQTCQFQDLKDGLIRDRVVCGITCDKIRSRLLKEPDLTLQKAIDIGRANEATVTQMKSFATNIHSKPADIHGVCKDKQACDRCGNWHTRQQMCPALEQNAANVGVRTILLRCAT